MDIIPCPDCGRIVSSDAITCPMCGFRLMQPLPPKQEPAPAAQEDFRRAAYGVLLLLAMCALIAAAFIILHTDRVSPPQPVGKTRQNNLPSQTGPETLLAQTRPVPREEIPTEEIEKPAKEHLRLPEKTGAAPEPDEQTDRPLPEKKRPLTPEEKKIATLLHGVKSEFNAGLWETAIRDCRELLP